MTAQDLAHPLHQCWLAQQQEDEGYEEWHDMYNYYIAKRIEDELEYQRELSYEWPSREPGHGRQTSLERLDVYSWMLNTYILFPRSLCGVNCLMLWV